MTYNEIAARRVRQSIRAKRRMGRFYLREAFQHLREGLAGSATLLRLARAAYVEAARLTRVHSPRWDRWQRTAPGLPKDRRGRLRGKVGA